MGFVIDVYDFKDKKWSKIPIPESVSFFSSATSVGTKLLFVEAHRFIELAVVHIYDFHTNTWSKQSLSQLRHGVSAITIGNQAFFAGGYSFKEESYSNVVDMYDYTTDKWSVITPGLSTPRKNISATSVGKLGFFAGGEDNNSDYGIIDIYNSTIGKFMTPKLFKNSKYTSTELMSMSIGTKVFFFHRKEQLADVYDSTTEKWSTVVFNPPK